jgi:hypothetical protein
MPVNSSNSGRKAGPLSGVSWTLSTPNTVAVIGIAAAALLIAMRQGFRPVNLG